MGLKLFEKHFFSSLFFSLSFLSFFLSFFLPLLSFFAGPPDKLAEALIFTRESIPVTDKYAILTGKNTDRKNNGTID